MEHSSACTSRPGSNRERHVNTSAESRTPRSAPPPCPLRHDYLLRPVADMTAPGAVIGLTGGIGVGKSTVANLLADAGAHVIDVDGLGRTVLEPGNAAYAEVVDAFGPEIVSADSSIDRAALAAVVFGPNNRLGELEAITHPAMNDVMTEQIANATADVVVLDMAILVESQLGRTPTGTMYDRVIVVEAPTEVRVPRLLQRGLTAEDAKARMQAQASDLERRLVADVVVTNDGTEDDLANAVAMLMPTIEAWVHQGRIHKGSRQ